MFFGSGEVMEVRDAKLDNYETTVRGVNDKGGVQWIFGGRLGKCESEKRVEVSNDKYGDWRSSMGGGWR